MKLRERIYYLREYFFPVGCAVCGSDLLVYGKAFYGLCDKCYNFFASFIYNTNRCKICGKALISEIETCILCKSYKGEGSNYCEGLTGFRTFFPYTGVFKSLLASYKFDKSLGLGNFFLECMMEALGHFESALDNAAWVPVPPRPGKIKKKGWDQIAFLSSLLANYSRASSGALPVSCCLKRLVSRSQKELNREDRKKNLRGRIQCIKKPPETAILFDDVITTGATINACTEALLKGGTKKVYAICLFYD